MQLGLRIRPWSKKGGWGTSNVQDPKAKNADKTNLLTFTDVECPDK